MSHEGPVSGPRPPASAQDEGGGAFQFPSMSTETKIRLPASWKGKYICIRWRATTTGEILNFLFVEDTAPDPLPSIDAATASSGTEPNYSRVDNAPEWVEDKGQEHRVVPFGGEKDVILLLEPSGDPGRVTVRLADG